MKLKLLFLIQFLYVYAYSQYEYRSGYIVKLDGKMEEGLIDSRASNYNAKQCEFKKDINAESLIYLPSEIAAYRFTDNKYFVSKKVIHENEETVVFLECLISGKVSIYYTKWDSYDHFYAEKEGKLLEISNNLIESIQDGHKYERPSNQYIGVLKYYFSDCPPVFQKLNNAVFSRKSLIKLSKEYQEYVSKDEQCVVYEKKYSKMHIRLGIDFSYGITKFEFNRGDKYFSTKLTDQFQCNINAQMKLDEGGAYYLQASLGYFANKFELSERTEKDLSGYTQNLSTDNIHYKISILKPAIHLKYKIKTGKIVPFVSVGLFSPFYLSDKAEYYNQYVNKTYSRNLKGYESEGKSTLMIGGSGEIGFETRMKPRCFSFSLFYERFLINPSSGTYNLGSKCGFYFN